MNQVKTINELINRTWRAPATALALTLFVFLFGTTTARAQGAGTGGGAGKVAVHDVGFAANVSVARGQIVRITFRIPDDQVDPLKETGDGTGLSQSTSMIADSTNGESESSFAIPAPGTQVMAAPKDSDGDRDQNQEYVEDLTHSALAVVSSMSSGLVYADR